MEERNADVDAWFGRATRWTDEARRLRTILLDCGLGEELKWGKPCYTSGGANLAIIQGFKAHCSLMFFKGALLDDEHGLLVPPGENSRVAMRVQFTSVRQIDEREPALRGYVEQAIRAERAGLEVDKDARPDLELPAELIDSLDADPDFAAAFHALTPGRQRGYVLHFAGAKQSKTRSARIAKSREKILAGKGMNDR